MKVAATTANQQNQSIAVANNVSKQKNNSPDDSSFEDNRPETKAIKSLQMMINDSPRMAAQRQQTSNITGGSTQVIKQPDTNVPNGPAESSTFIRLYAPTPVIQAQQVIQRAFWEQTDTEPIWHDEDVDVDLFEPLAEQFLPGPDERDKESFQVYRRKPVNEALAAYVVREWPREGGDFDYFKEIAVINTNESISKEGANFQQAKAYFVRHMIGSLIWKERDEEAAECIRAQGSTVDLDGPTRYGRTLLTLALTMPVENSFFALLEAGVNINKRDELGDTPLMLAVYQTDRPQFFKSLRDRGAEVAPALESPMIAKVFLDQLRKELLPDLDQRLQTGFSRIFAIRLCEDIHPDYGMKPQVLFDQLTELTMGKCRLFKEYVLETAVEESQRLLMGKDIQRIINEVEQTMKISDSEEMRLKFLAHLIEAEGTLEEQTFVKLEGFDYRAALMHYARGLMFAVNRLAPESTEIPILLEKLHMIVCSCERAVELDLIDRSFGGMDAKMETIDLMREAIERELSAGRGILVQTGYSPSPKERSGHAAYATVHKDILRVHNLGGGMMRGHTMEPGALKYFPYIERPKDLVGRLIDLLKAKLHIEKFALQLIYTQEQPPVKEFMGTYVAQPAQLVGNCTIANLNNALLTMFVDQFGPEDGMVLMELITQRIREFAILLLEKSPHLEELLGTKKKEALQKRLSEAIVGKNQDEIVRLVQDGAKLTLEMLSDRKHWIGLAMIVKQGGAGVIEALRDRGLPDKGAVIVALETAKIRLSGLLQDVFNLLFP